tara:strand:+ start:183 stop:815 length:633 start_codon:yes stop_codon:yes gene_type:complete
MTHIIEEHKTESELTAKAELDSMSTEQLDAIAKEFKPKSPYNEEWHQEFTRRALAFAEMFEDGDEVIIKAKLQDQLPRMFEKMRDSVQDTAEKLLRERQILVRQHVGIEITGNKLDDHDKKIEQMRQQYASLNDAFNCLLTHFRPMIKGQTGIDFGKYTKLSEFAKVKRLQTRNKKLTLDTYLNSKEAFNDLFLDVSNQEGIVELPEHLE